MRVSISLLRLLSRLTVAVLAATSSASFADNFPSRALTVIVPSTPGGILDQTGRLIAAELTKVLGQPVVVDNKPGGGQIIAMQTLLNAVPDGHTLVMGSIAPNAANYSLYPKLPYTPGDFAAVAHVVSMPNVLLAHPSLPVGSVQELVALAKSRPGSLSIASSGIGTSSHLSAELLKMRAGVDLVHVPYKGASPAIADLVGGQVNLMIDNLITALPQVNAGKLKALAVTSAQRVSDLADVPTVAESGYPDFEVTVWVGVMAPAKTPKATVDILHKEIVRILQQPHVRERIAAMGGASIPMTMQQFSEFIDSEISKWSAVVRQGNIRLE